MNKTFDPYGPGTLSCVKSLGQPIFHCVSHGITEDAHRETFQVFGLLCESLHNRSVSYEKLGVNLPGISYTYF
jgi:hypothetical protein